MQQTSIFPTVLSRSPSLPSTPSLNPFRPHRMAPLLRFPCLLLIPRSRPRRLTLSVVVGAKSRRGRRRRPAGSPDITVLKRALSLATSIRRLLLPPGPLDPLHLGFGGDGGGGPGGFGSGGFGGGWWFERRRWPKGRGLMDLLISSSIVVAAIMVLGKGSEGDWGIRVLVPAIVGLKIRAWRGGIGTLILLGLAFYVLLRLRKKAAWRF